MVLPVSYMNETVLNPGGGGGGNEEMGNGVIGVDLRRCKALKPPFLPLSHCLKSDQENVILYFKSQRRLDP